MLLLSRTWKLRAQGRKRGYGEVEITRVTVNFPKLGEYSDDTQSSYCCLDAILISAVGAQMVEL